MNRRIPLTLLLIALVLLSTLGAASAEDGNNVYLPQLTGGSAGNPTATPTVTTQPTATATSQPTPTGTLAPPELIVMGNSTAFTDTIDALHIVGEVWNQTQTNMEFVKITANLYDADDQIIDTGFTYSRVDVLAPGERSCFNLILYPGPPEWSTYELDVSGRVGGDVMAGLTVTQHSGGFNIMDWYEIVGMIRNDAGVTVESVQSIATLYDKSDKVIGCHFTFTTDDSLGPGASSSFKHTVLNISKDDFDRYQLQTDGRLP